VKVVATLSIVTAIAALVVLGLRLSGDWAHASSAVPGSVAPSNRPRIMLQCLCPVIDPITPAQWQAIGAAVRDELEHVGFDVLQQSDPREVVLPAPLLNVKVNAKQVGQGWAYEVVLEHMDIVSNYGRMFRAPLFQQTAFGVCEGGEMPAVLCREIHDLLAAYVAQAAKRVPDNYVPNAHLHG
jgi:hypothetical protein